jgi:Holliday junction resolvase RusA-like endonuclease
MTRIELPFEPMACPRPRVRKGGWSYMPTKYKKWKSQVQEYLKFQYHGHLLSDPLSINIVFHIKRPQSVTRALPFVNPDLDNYIKGVLDCMNGICYKDDAQIIEMYATKKYSDNPKIVIDLGLYEDDTDIRVAG